MAIVDHHPDDATVTPTSVNGRVPRPGELLGIDMADNIALPILPAYRTSNGFQLAIFCGHCHRWHRHGRHRGTGRVGEACGPDGDCICRPGVSDGPKGVHCLCQKRFCGGRYVLREVGELTPELEASFRELSIGPSCSWARCRFERSGQRRRLHVVRSEVDVLNDLTDTPALLLDGRAMLARLVDAVLAAGRDGMPLS